MSKRKMRDIIIAAMLEMVAYAIEEGEDVEVPACLRMLAKMLRK